MVKVLDNKSASFEMQIICDNITKCDNILGKTLYKPKSVAYAYRLLFY